MVLELESMQKTFGGAVALRRGSLVVRAGEVHLLLGENGAGKSTLMKIAAGMLRPDAGTLRWRGAAARFLNPAEAQRAGVAMVHQESLLAPHLSVAQNIFLGREISGRFGLLDRRREQAEARRLIEEHRFPLQPEWKVERLSPAGRQLVEILRAIAQQAALLIFDEPTSALSDAETKEVFRVIAGLRERGAAVIYITHRMEELRALGDRATVLRDGETVFTGAMAETGTDELIRHMAGRPLDSVYRREPLPPGRERLRVELPGVEFSLHSGEITGLAGLVGAGRTELCRAIFGIEPLRRGRLLVDGEERRIRSPRDAVAAGIALIPEDRQRHGLAPALPVGHNVTLAALGRLSRFGVLNQRAERALFEEQAARLRLKAESPRQPAARLSGGNQQKAVIAKWMARGAGIYLFDEPARGIDIGAKIEVFERMDELARGGAAILMASSELPELLQVADRILVLRQGRLAAELPRHATQEEILRHAALEPAS